MTLPLTLNNPSRIAPLVAAAALAALIVLAVLAGHVIDDGGTTATTASEERNAGRDGGVSPWLFVVVAGMLALGTALAALQVATGSAIDEDLLPPQ